MKVPVALFGLLLGLVSGHGIDVECGIMPPPGATLSFPLRGLPPHLRAEADGVDEPAQCSVFFPENYNLDDSFALIVWNSGGKGGDGTGIGWPRAMVGDRDFIIVGRPLWKADFDREGFLGDPDVEGDEAWIHLLIDDEDAAINRKALQVVLSTVFAAVPNIDPERCFLGGFSNGAHVTAVMLNEATADLHERFQGFILAEGGDSLRRYDRLAGRPVILMQGGESKTGRWMDSLRDGLTAAGAEVTYFLMEGVGHAMPEPYVGRVGHWLRMQAGLVPATPVVTAPSGNAPPLPSPSSASPVPDR